MAEKRFYDVKQRHTALGDLMASCETPYGFAIIRIGREEIGHIGNRLNNVIGSRIANAERAMRDKRTDAEWLAETVGADG